MTQIYGHPKEEIWIKKIAFLWDISPETVAWIKDKMSGQTRFLLQSSNLNGSCWDKSRGGYIYKGTGLLTI